MAFGVNSSIAGEIAQKPSASLGGFWLGAFACGGMGLGFAWGAIGLWESNWNSAFWKNIWKSTLGIWGERFPGGTPTNLFWVLTKDPVWAMENIGFGKGVWITLLELASLQVFTYPCQTNLETGSINFGIQHWGKWGTRVSTPSDFPGAAGKSK